MRMDGNGFALAAFVFALFFGPAAGAGERATSEDLQQALAAELERSVEGLRLPDAPDIYHLRFSLLQRTVTETVACHGAIVEHDSSPSNLLGVEVRVGAPTFDNTNFGGWETGFAETRLPDDLTVDSLQNEAWLLADAAYKKAIEQYARKQAQWSPPSDHPGDFEMAGPWTATAQPPRSAHPAILRDLAADLSGAFPAQVPLDRAEVHVDHGAGTLLVIDSQGTRVVTPVEWTTVRAVAHLRLEDGSLLTDHCSWIVSDIDQLPSFDQQSACVQLMTDRLSSQGAALVPDEEYVGPVLFEDAAAADLFRELLTGQLEGTPAVASFDTFFGGLGDSWADSRGGIGDVRVGRRVLPGGWSAFDDPQLDAAHPASFTHDREGTPAQRIAVVTDGITRDLLMSRVPRKGQTGTNGHARGELGARLSGRVSMLSIEPPRRMSRAQLHKKAFKIAASYGHDHVLVVRRHEDAAVRHVGGIPSMSFSYGSDGAQASFHLPRPLRIVRLYADGREEPLRNLAFAGVHRWVLRDIIGAGPQQESTYLAPTLAGQPSWGPTQGMATFISAPEVLVGEMELVPVSGDPKDAHVVPAP